MKAAWLWKDGKNVSVWGKIVTYWAVSHGRVALYDCVRSALIIGYGLWISETAVVSPDDRGYASETEEPPSLPIIFFIFCDRSFRVKGF